MVLLVALQKRISTGLRRKNNLLCSAKLAIAIMGLLLIIFASQFLHYSQSQTVRCSNSEEVMLIGQQEEVSGDVKSESKPAASGQYQLDDPLRYIVQASDDSLISEWRGNKKLFCNGNYSGVANEFAVLRNVLVDRTLMKPVGNRIGGESIEEVMMQDEKLEYFIAEKGTYRVGCPESEQASYEFAGGANNWLEKAKQSIEFCTADRKCNLHYDIVSNVTLFVVQRYNYASIWHSMCDWYNAFVAMVYLKIDPSAAHVLFFDAHPQTIIDDMWRQLFARQLYVRDLPERALYPMVVLSIHNYRSFIASYVNWNSMKIPMAEQFSRFVLARFGLVGTMQTRLNCSKLRVTLLLRRNYLSHPRNARASVGRKIKNGEQLLESINKSLNGGLKYRGVAQAVFFEATPFLQQLRIVSNSDVLIGMHGAGLSHAMFLPHYGGLLELRQKHATGRAFEAIAKSRNMSYVDDVVDPKDSEDHQHETEVPLDKAQQLLASLLKQMGCEA